MSTANGTGGRHPTPLSNAPAFESDSEAFDEGLRLLGQLQLLRGFFGREPDNARGDSLIREYCVRLRRSPSSITFARLQREEHLADPWIVAVLYTVSSMLGLRIGGRPTECAVLAMGADFLQQRWFLFRLQMNRGPGRLFRYSLEGGLGPSTILLDSISRWTMFSEAEIENFRKTLAEWPTKTGIEDIDDQRELEAL